VSDVKNFSFQYAHLVETGYAVFRANIYFIIFYLSEIDHAP
jgi:hypothetical protein